MTTATTICAAINTASWNRLEHVARTSKNRKILAAVLHAENACITNGPRRHITDNRIVGIIIERAIAGNWNDVLLSAAGSPHMTPRDYADIISAGTIFTEEVYAAILDSAAVRNRALMSMLENGVPYPAIREGARKIRIDMVRSTIKAALSDPAEYALDGDDEHPEVAAAVTIALALDRHDLVRELVATGCTGPFTAEYILAA